jgi:hypothetical protein
MLTPIYSNLSNLFSARVNWTIKRQGFLNWIICLLRFFVTSQLEMLRTLDGNLLTAFALRAFKTKYQLLGGLFLLLQDGFGLTFETFNWFVTSKIELSNPPILEFKVLQHAFEMKKQGLKYFSK